MANKSRGHLSLLGEAVIRELQEQGRYERALSRFSADDDLPNVLELSPLNSAQSRRMPMEVH